MKVQQGHPRLSHWLVALSILLIVTLVVPIIASFY